MDQVGTMDAGIGALPAIAQRISTFGRNGDTFLGHLEKDDTVIPMAVLDANPVLKQSLFTHMQEMGVDPKRYIVGTNFNSINPDTGLPEFFLKDLWNGIKNVVKAVAPVVLPFAVGAIFPNLGPVLSGAVGAGIGSLIGGAKGADALKMAALGGAAGGIYSGLQAGFSNTGGTFGSRFMEGATQPFRDLGASISNTVSSPFTQVSPSQSSAEYQKLSNVLSEAGINPAPTPGSGQGTSQGGFMSSILPKSAPSLQEGLAAVGATPSSATPAQLALAQDWVKKNTPGFLSNYGPLMALGGIGAYAAGAFNAPKAQAPADFYGGATGKSLLESTPDKYRLGVYQRRQPQYAMSLPPLGYAAGGPAFPRRTGGIAGPGTGTSDNVPAMLSDGEFVMTARAVRGAGDGSRRNGMRTMYQMMRRFERNA